MGAIASQITKSLALRLFTKPFLQTQLKENIKAPRHWPLWGTSSGTGEFPAQMTSNAENVLFDDVIMNAMISDTLETPPAEIILA